MSRQEMSISRVTRSKEAAKASYDQLSRCCDLLAGRFELIDQSEYLIFSPIIATDICQARSWRGL